MQQRQKTGNHAARQSGGRAGPEHVFLPRQTMHSSHNNTSHAKIIFISGYDNFDYAVSALQLGAVHYILKPIKQQALLDTLEKTIQQQISERKEHDTVLAAQHLRLSNLLCKLANGISASIPEDILQNYRIGLLSQIGKVHNG